MLHSQVALPSTFGELSEKIFLQLPCVKRVDFITDSYHSLSIKRIERERRGSSRPHIIKGTLTKIPCDWKVFLMNEDNKKQLIRFLLKEWSGDKYAVKLRDREIMYVSEEKCVYGEWDGRINQYVVVNLHRGLVMGHNGRRRTPPDLAIKTQITSSSV